MKKTKFYWSSLVLIIIFFIGLAIYLPSISPSIQGDGNEYILQTAAFQNHLSFGISQDDLELAKKQFYNNQDSLQKTFDAIIHDEEGWAYSNHFGAYSALVTIIKLILISLNIYPLWAFSITNLLLWLSASLTIFFVLKIDDKKKFCILLLMLFNPVFYYLDWVHTEIYIFSFEVIALVLLYNRSYALSILAFSIAAMQNLGILPMAAIVGIMFLFDCYDKYVIANSNKNVRKFLITCWKQILPYGLFYLPAFFPMITTYIKFGTYNLVAEVAMEKKYLLHKAIDYLFDPNLGIFPYEPIILILFFVFVIIGLKKLDRTIILNFIGVIGILYIISHQRQINSGMQGIMRYCVWIIPIMVFLVVMNWKVNFSKSMLLTCSIEALFTAIVLSYCVWFGGAYSYIQFAKWTELILDHIPELYNPTHGIFYSRTGGEEKYHSSIPMAYFNKEGYVRKILLSKEAEKYFWDDNFKLVDANGDFLNKNELEEVKIDEGDYSYYNFSDDIICANTYALGDIIYFYTDSYNANLYSQKGLSAKENWGSWTDGNELRLRMIVTENSPTLSAHMDIGSTFYQPQTVIIYVNDTEVYHNVIEGNQDIDFVFQPPQTGLINIVIKLPDAIAPSEVMNSSDSRVLGLGLLSMQLNQADIS